MSKLLSDEELRNAITETVVDYHNTDYAKVRSDCIDGLLNLINTQKRLYAESVIGKDEIDREWHCPCGTTHPLIGSNDVRNQLRAEQRARIK